MAQTLVWRPWDFHHTETNLSPVGSDDASPLPESCDTSPIAGSHNDSLVTDSCQSTPNQECCPTSFESEQMSPSPRSDEISPYPRSDSPTQCASIESSPNQENSSISPALESCEISSIPTGSSSPWSSSDDYSPMSENYYSSPESNFFIPHYLAPQSHVSRSPPSPRSPHFNQTPCHNKLPASLHYNQVPGHNILPRYLPFNQTPSHFNQIAYHNTSPRLPLYIQSQVPSTTYQHLPPYYRPDIFRQISPLSSAIHTTTRPIYQPPTNRPIYQPPTTRPIYQPPIYPPPTNRPIYQSPTIRPIYQPPNNLYSNIMPPPAAFIPDLRNLHLLQSVACSVQPFYPLPSSTPSNHMPQYTRSIQVDEPLDLTSVIKQEINESNINQVQRQVPDSTNNGHQQYNIDINTSYHHLLKQEIVTDEDATILYDDDIPQVTKYEEDEDDFIIDVVTCDNEDQGTMEDVPEEMIMEDIHNDLTDQREVEHNANQLTTVYEAHATTDHTTADNQTVTKTEDDVAYQMKTEQNTESKTIVVELHVPTRKRKGGNTDNNCSTAKQAKKDNSAKREKVMPYGDHELHVMNITFDATNMQRFCDEKGNYVVPKIPEDRDLKQELKAALIELFANSNLPKFPEQLKDNLQFLCYFPQMVHLHSLHQDGVDIQTLKFTSNGFSFQNPQLAALGEEKFNQFLDSMYQTDGEGIMHCCVPYGDHELHLLNIKFDLVNKPRFCDESGNYVVPKIPEDQDLKQELKAALFDLFTKSNLPKFPEQLKDNLQFLCYFPCMVHLHSLHQDGIDIQTLKFSSNGFSFQNPQLAALGEEKFNQFLDSMYQTDDQGIMHCCVPRSVDDGALCGHVTKERGKMRRHCKVHFPHKKWVCCFCRAQMFDTTDMDRHTPLHTGLKPYTCTQCGTQYAQKISLVSHIKRHHS